MDWHYYSDADFEHANIMLCSSILSIDSLDTWVICERRMTMNLNISLR